MEARQELELGKTYKDSYGDTYLITSNYFDDRTRNPFLGVSLNKKKVHTYSLYGEFASGCPSWHNLIIEQST